MASTNNKGLTSFMTMMRNRRVISILDKYYYKITELNPTIPKEKPGLKQLVELQPKQLQ